MSNVAQSVSALLTIDGATAAAVVDSNSGMVLGKEGTGVNLDLAAAGNTEVVRAKLKTMRSLGLKDTIEDILITLGTAYHIIRPVADKPGLFVYLVLDRSKSNLAMARHKVTEIEGLMTV
jgi:hypothetical protein